MCILWYADRYNVAMKNIVRYGPLARIFRNLKLLLPLIRDYLKGTYRDVSVKSIVMFILTLANIISFLDLIPDWILGFGQIDELAILAFGIQPLEKDLLKYKEWNGIIIMLEGSPFQGDPKEVGIT